MLQKKFKNEQGVSMMGSNQIMIIPTIFNSPNEVSVDNDKLHETLRSDSLYHAKTKFNNCFII
jgi:hypothetical protein